MSNNFREWLERIGDQLDTGNVTEALLRSAQKSHRLGMLALPGAMLEESRLLIQAVSHSPSVGFQLPSPEDLSGNDEYFNEIKQSLKKTVDDHALSADTNELLFVSLGVGHETGAGILLLSISVASLCASSVTAIANWPKAVENIQRWCEAIKAILEDRRCKPTLETLKMLCVGDLLASHPKKPRIEAGLISADFGTRERGMTKEIVRVGPVYVVIPVPEVEETHFYIIDWKGNVIHRSQLQYVGPTQEMLDDWRTE